MSVRMLALLAALLDQAKASGYPAISLSVDRDNRARHLYERSGFTDAGVSSDQDTSVTLIHRWNVKP